jgi:TPR repeat protein
MRYLFAILLLCLLAAPVRAQDFDAGARAYQRGDYAAALGHWRPLAAAGDTAARFGLAIMHSLGRGVARDQPRGLTIFVDSFESGTGLPPDHPAALKFWRQAAQRGDAGAQYLLGLMHNWGRGVPRDYFAAVSWYHRAAEQGAAAAQTLLADMFHKGDGVPRNRVEAYKWYAIAAAKGDAKADDSRAFIAQQMRPDDILLAQRRARAWLARQAK